MEKLAKEIFEELLGTDEEVTMEQALEMAKMESQAKKIARYEKSDTPRKKVTRERKVDEEKKYLLNKIIEVVNNETCILSVKNETEFSFVFGDNSYTIKLIKHRPLKN